MWTSTDLFGVSVLWSAASSSRDRGANSGFGTLLESLSWFDVLLVSLSWYKPWVQQTGLVCPTHTPVTIVVQTLVRRPPRVAIVVQTGGETLGGKWLCVCFSPYCKDSGFRLGSRTGGKVTCRNSKTARNTPKPLSQRQPLFMS